MSPTFPDYCRRLQFSDTVPERKSRSTPQIAVRTRFVASSPCTSQTGQISDQIVDLRSGRLGLVAGHQALAHLFIELLKIGLAERIELVAGVPHLNGEGVFVDSNAAHLFAVARDHSNR